MFDLEKNYDKLYVAVYHKDRLPEGDLIVEEFLDLCLVVVSIEDMGRMIRSSILSANKKFSDRERGELLRRAKENTFRTENLRFSSMRDVLSEMMGGSPLEVEEEDSLYLLSNKFNYLGASYIYDVNTLNAISSMLGTNFWILPSSIHEILIAPDRGLLDFKELEEMVKSINDSMVEEKDILSYSVYYYNKDKKEVKIYES